MTTNRTDEAATLLADHLVAICTGKLTDAELADWARTEFPTSMQTLNSYDAAHAWELATQYADVETDDDDLHAALLAECARLVTA